MVLKGCKKQLDAFIAERCSKGCYIPGDCRKSLNPDYWRPSKHPRQLLCVCPVPKLFCRHTQLFGLQDRVSG